ncbi:hypothetical protein B0H11DRAFT_1956098 [Mycena galericulata]|nr:hypothetical protein B0H11DRAFT_1956098 [Mycena galericulata]
MVPSSPLSSGFTVRLVLYIPYLTGCPSGGWPISSSTTSWQCRRRTRSCDSTVTLLYYLAVEFHCNYCATCSRPYTFH